MEKKTVIYLDYTSTLNWYLNHKGCTLENLRSYFFSYDISRTASLKAVWGTWGHLSFTPIRCTTMLCHFSSLGNSSVFIHFIPLSSTATSSASSEYGTVPESIGQIEEPARTNQEQTRNELSSAPKMYLNDAQWDHFGFFKHVIKSSFH